LRRVQELGDTHTVVDRLVVLERERRCAPERELAGDPAPEVPVRRLQALERRRPLVLLPQHAHVYAGVPEICAGLDSGNGHKSDPWILQVPGDRIAEYGPHRLI